MRRTALLEIILLGCAAAAYGNPRVEISGRDVLLDGKNHIPHGIVHAGEEHFPDLVKLGINSIHIDVPFNKFDPDKSDEENRQALQPWIERADAAHASKMTVLWLFSFHYTPGWLWDRYPDVRMKNHDQSDGSGGWIKMCLNHPGFRTDAEKWIRFIAKTLGSHPATIGYVLWNEPHLTGDVDYNKHTVAAFHDWLVGQYKAIESLNTAWGTSYKAFAAVDPPAPRSGTYWDEVYDRMAAGRGVAAKAETADGAEPTNPALWMAWMRFRQENFVEFWEWEARIIRDADAGALITSKIVPFDLYTSHAHGAGINTELWTSRFLDVVGMDLYSHLDENFLARWKCDYFRSLSQNKPIWHTEFNFTFVKERGLATPEQWRTTFYYQLARGVNGFWNFCWDDSVPYSLAYKGHRPSPVTQEIGRLSPQIEKLAPLMQGLKPAPAQVAVLHSTTTGLAVGGDYAPTADQTTMIELLYRNQTPFDFVSEDMVRNGALSKYRVLVAVGTVAIADDVLDAIGRFIDANGGHVIANARFAELDEHGRKREVHPPAWMGAEVQRYRRKPRRRTGHLELKRKARSFEDKPIDVHVKLDTYSSKPIQLGKYKTTGSGPIFGDEDTQLPWSSGGRHDMYWEDVLPLGDAEVVGPFATFNPGMVSTEQTLYIARDICWVDDKFEDLFRKWLQNSGVHNRNQAVLKDTRKPATSVDIRMWENDQRRLLFVINSAPTLDYDGEPIDVEVTFDSYGEVTDALTGKTVPSKWYGFKRVVPMHLEAGQVRVLLGKPYTPGWKSAKEKYEEVQEHYKPDKPYKVWWKKRNEMWVYDARTELGMGMHGVTDEQAQMVRKLGVRLVRKTVYWYHIEKTDQPGVYDEDGLASYDRIVQLAKDNGIELVLLLHGNPPGTGWENRHESYDRFAQFAAFMVKRYPSVRFWELWNEMDVGFTDLFGANRPGYPHFERGRCYGQMLNKAYPAIKAANPDAWVLLGGIGSGNAPYFIPGIYAEDARHSFDFMNIHTYGVPVNWSMAVDAYATRAAMGRYGDFDRPLWNTEFGIDAGNLWAAWKVDTGEKFDQGHLSAWQSCINDSLANQLYWKILPYQFAAGNERANDVLKKPDSPIKLPEGHTLDDYGFGLVRSDGKTPRPTYNWLLEQQVNKPINDEPRLKRDLVLEWNGKWQPKNFLFKGAETKITIRDVKVDSLLPKIIHTTPYTPPLTEEQQRMMSGGYSAPPPKTDEQDKDEHSGHDH